MGFKEIQDLNPDNVISLGGKNKKTGKTNPKSIEGYYLGSRSVPDKKKKSGVSYIYVFQTHDGNVGVWGKTDLDQKMASVTPGTMTRIVSTGTRPTPNGEMYTYKVEIDHDNTVEVNGALMTSSEQQEEACEEESDDDTSYSGRFDEDEASLRARQKETMDLLSGKNKKA